MSLPWERWQPEPIEPEPVEPEPVEPEPELPPDLVIPRPKPRPDIPIGDLTHDAISDALDKLWPDLREDAIGYVKDSFKEIQKGHTVDVLHPTVVAETAAGKELIVADAKSRSWRTLVQGLIFDVFAAIVAAVAMLTGADPFVKETWIAFGILLLKSVVSAVISYVMRLKVQPTIKTPGQRMNVMPVPTRIEEEETAA